MREIKYERIRAHAVGGILGISARTVQSLAARGELPGAAKIGGVWTFDEKAIRDWVKSISSTGEAGERPSTSAKDKADRERYVPLRVANSMKACEQALQRLRRLK